ncbi:LysR substrate-binding domain-containing protein [Anabaena cylindrica UHCC 0172]|uniref:LysR substrate-binding domain-containing protein n=1 Tax=Anabaena cylindrica TaxID=1165 RepID=UPI002B1F900B|nr:LysR substrate-binding domain-containing protein [Anabaena cylindrica]MEA5554225.1 LysR substrate-binding domain-containing protein [Anabaena cylindrica UHCC 0172]
MENLNDIMIFTKIVEQGSLTAAAENLTLPKSSISRALSRLEAQLGTRLLQRSTRRIHLTEIGRCYYDHCCRIVQELEVANSMVENYQSQPSGLLRITASYILGQAFLGAIVIEFLNSYPNVQCKVELSNRRIDLIEEGFDLGIRIGKLPDSSLMMQHLGQATAALFASPIYLEKHGNPQIPEDLQNHILLDNTKTLKKSWKLCQGSLQTEIPVLPRLVCNDMAILLEAAIAHQGIAVLPIFATIDAVKNFQLKPVLQDWYVKKVEINALHPFYKDLSPAVNAFINLARQSLKNVLSDV